MMADLGTLFTKIVDDKRANPGDDLTSALIAASEDGDHLTNEEIVNTLQLIIAAGHETTISLVVNVVEALQTHPEQRRRVLSGEVPWENVIEETLRWNTPTSHVLIRFATEDIEVGDKVLPKGEGLIVSFGALGRDEQQYGPTMRRVRRHPLPEPTHRFRPWSARLPGCRPVPAGGGGRPPRALRALPGPGPRRTPLRPAEQADRDPERPARTARRSGLIRASFCPFRRVSRGPEHESHPADTVLDRFPEGLRPDRG